MRTFNIGPEPPSPVCGAEIICDLADFGHISANRESYWIVCPLNPNGFFHLYKGCEEYDILHALLQREAARGEVKLTVMQLLTPHMTAVDVLNLLEDTYQKGVDRGRSLQAAKVREALLLE